jgi:hypothetical protein
VHGQATTPLATTPLTTTPLATTPLTNTPLATAPLATRGANYKTCAAHTTAAPAGRRTDTMFLILILVVDGGRRAVCLGGRVVCGLPRADTRQARNLSTSLGHPTSPKSFEIFRTPNKPEIFQT